jgi:glycosyltransferase involved in cell wall biosynthesis
LLVRREAETLHRAGYDVDVVCPRAKAAGGDSTINGVRIHGLPLKRNKGSLVRYLFDYLALFLLVAWTLTWLHLQRPFACIQVNNMPDFLVFSTLIPRLLGAKVTMVMYEPSPELWATKYNMPLVMRLVSITERLSLRYAHAVFAVTEQMKQAFVSRGTNPDKISVILNVTSGRFFDGYIQDEVESRNGKYTLICHGAVEERYGHDTMLKAIDRLRSQIPGVQLRVLGAGSYEDRFLEQIADMGLEDHVEYLGFVPLAEMVAELSSADVGIVAQKSSPYSNLVHTGKMYDYLHFGLPVISSRLKAVEAYFDEDSICFFEPDDSASLAQVIIDLYQHPDKHRALVGNSQRLYARYKWDQQKKVYLSVYRELLN